MKQALISRGRLRSAGVLRAISIKKGGFTNEKNVSWDRHRSGHRRGGGIRARGRPPDPGARGKISRSSILTSVFPLLWLVAGI